MFASSRQRRIWREAFRTHLPRLRATRAELRETLCHIGPGGFHALTLDGTPHSDKTTLDLRRMCGPSWFDNFYGGTNHA